MTNLSIRSTFATVTAFFIFSIIGSSTALAAGPAPVNLLSAGNFAILSKTGITDANPSVITGNIGAYPISGAAILVTCPEVTGTIYSRNAAGPLPCRVINATLLNTAVNHMGTAYTDAAGRTGPTATELGGGNIGGMVLAPGLYTWSTDVTIPTDLTLSGGANDIWIFQIAGDLSIASGGSVPTGVKVNLVGGAQAGNVFWQVGGPIGATLGTYSTFNGTILSAKQIILQSGAVLNGRALARTQVTLDANVVTATPIIVPALPGEIRGTKYEDSDGDGIVRENKDRTLSGWTIYLDTNNNGLLDSGESSTVTDRNGSYRFTDIPAGNYTVREVLQTGWIQTYPANNSHAVPLLAGSVSKKNNFGNFRLETIAGMKFNDVNANRRKDRSEVGLQGWTINLTRVGSPTIIASAVTDVNGNYAFTNIGPGTYQVREVQQTGWVQTTRNPADITVRSGTQCTTSNFGNHFGPVGL